MRARGGGSGGGVEMGVERKAEARVEAAEWRRVTPGLEVRSIFSALIRFPKI